jgi:hypothetical protein
LLLVDNSSGNFQFCNIRRDPPRVIFGAKPRNASAYI